MDLSDPLRNTKVGKGTKVEHPSLLQTMMVSYCGVVKDGLPSVWWSG
jgi:hypothetical protein